MVVADDGVETAPEAESALAQEWRTLFTQPEPLAAATLLLAVPRPPPQVFAASPDPERSDMAF